MHVFAALSTLLLATNAGYAIGHKRSAGQGYSNGNKFSGVARSASTGDFYPNKCAYNDFSSVIVPAAESRFAYVTSAYWSKDLPCGRCANVTVAPADDPQYAMPNSTVTVMLISQFDETCTSDDGTECVGDLLLSTQAYREMLNGGTGSRFDVNWELVKCPDDFVRGGVEFAFGDGTSANMLTVQPRNFHGQIASLEVKFDDGSRYPFGAPGQDTTGSYRMVLAPKKDGLDFSKPFTLVATQAISGYSIEVKVDELPEASLVVVTDAQF
ncbi:hypothetical protein Poli38472_005930 [Pythium oligandrum]|uniref:Expansin-like EG45 domain-containing protein n=1 Tax=Pythium oligandrum TaxID=41045 RepID=A0A8K1FQZ9_PYTOL|nr:hypothetical protein Poli38472_005930 [Pythium oligandrum]|eukprot:TMW68462.1 hypothetical protein Poli38472_005930 [Pythium oligandrum]